MSPVPSHLLSFNLVDGVKEINNLINHPIMSLLDTRVGGTRAHVVTKSIKFELMQPQVERGIFTIIGICDLTDMAKKVCQRLADQVSSL